ncbi:hypothetical protein IQ255_15420 [Pleurocapsales cyanobacterium LEGE 10410]|nr:hypothetical protein [Pleurocapsales cyanobacterium LEGE 10410]
MDVYVRPLEKLFQVTNDENGIKELTKILSQIKPELIVLEATGGMELNAATQLTQAELSGVRPRYVRNSAR